MTVAPTSSIVMTIVADSALRRLAQDHAGEEVFMRPPHFHVGDRVRTIHPLVSLPARSTGMIYRVTRVGNFYGVLFDGEAVIRVMHHGYLEPAVLQERTIGTPDA